MQPSGAMASSSAENIPPVGDRQDDLGAERADTLEVLGRVHGRCRQHRHAVLVRDCLDRPAGKLRAHEAQALADGADRPVEPQHAAERAREPLVEGAIDGDADERDPLPRVFGEEYPE